MTLHCVYNMHNDLPTWVTTGHPISTLEVLGIITILMLHSFVIDVVVKGVRYRGFGSNKKKAKHAAARTALSAMTTPLRGNDFE